MIGFGDRVRRLGDRLRLVVQGFYKPQPLFQKARFADEILGGLLGLVQAALIFGAVLIILDSFFRIPGIPPDPEELRFLRDFWNALDASQIADIFRDDADPGVLRAHRASSSRTRSRRSTRARR